MNESDTDASPDKAREALALLKALKTAHQGAGPNRDFLPIQHLHLFQIECVELHGQAVENRLGEWITQVILLSGQAVSDRSAIRVYLTSLQDLTFFLDLLRPEPGLTKTLSGRKQRHLHIHPVVWMKALHPKDTTAVALLSDWQDIVTLSQSMTRK